MNKFCRFGWTILLISCSPTMPTERPVAETMDQIVSRLLEEFNSSHLDTVGHDFILQYISEDEKSSLGSQFWNFGINVPATVSVMRDTQQKNVPFWLEKSGFEKSTLEVKNSQTTYEVWQKNYNAGRVDLGINGFEKHRPVYFVSVAPLNPDDSLQITPVFPEHQYFQRMEKGSFTYHDWDELTLVYVPEALQGQVLLSTIRGRAREAHLIDAFRKTKFPSSLMPDQIVLTWSGEASTTMDIQWRSGHSVQKGTVRYWIKEDRDTLETTAEKYRMEDRLLLNDQFINRFTANLQHLKPGTTYEYMVKNDGRYSSEKKSFTTAKADPSSFSFIWTGDVHNSKVWGKMVLDAWEKHPRTRFLMAAGDLVNTGLYRDDWDELFHYPSPVFASIPFMAVPGNHDSQDGLGAWMYKEMFSYPDQAPSPSMAEMTYSFSYQNAFFLMIDATFPIKEQSHWIEEQLAKSKSDWKFAMFHFPPYNSIEFYEEIITEWVPIFDKYHVDMVMSGHFHYYLRTKPLHAGKVMESPAGGTIYLMSIGTTGKNKEMKDAPYAALQFGGEHLYQHVVIKDKTLTYTSYGLDGRTRDHLAIFK